MKKYFVLLALLALGHSPAFAQKKPAPKPTAKAAPKAAVAPAVLLRGKAVYIQNCLSCHQADGGGVDGMNPPLTQIDYVLGDKTRLITVLLNGLKGQEINGEKYRSVMPSQAHLTDQQLADVLTYIRNNFGNKASAVAVGEVKAVRAVNKQ